MSSRTCSQENWLYVSAGSPRFADTDANALFKVLTAVSFTLTEDKIGSINLKTLQSSSRREFSDIDDVLLKKALHILKTNVETGEIPKPEILGLREGTCRGLPYCLCQ